MPDSSGKSSRQRVAVVGLGPIGTKVVEALDRGIDGLVLAAVSVNDPAKHQRFLAGLKQPPAVLPIEGGWFTVPEEPGLGELVDREATAVADGHKPGVPEPAQVVGQPRWRYLQQLAQLTGRGGPLLEALKHGVPGFVR